MASASDVRAILQLPQPTASTSTSQPPKKGPVTRKPEGISRELYSLIGDSAPSLVAQYARPKFKPKLELGKGRTKWARKSFSNPARNDALKLSHWVKSSEDQQDAASAFALYSSKPSQVFTYSQEEYNSYLEDPDWSQEETNYLFLMAREYDVRFLVMVDRYHFPGGTSRKIEDLQYRYYTVCRRLIRNRDFPGDEQARLHLLSTYNFDLPQERMRKEYLRSLFNRTPEQIAEEEALYIEVKRLELNERRWAKERDELLKTQAGIESGLNVDAHWDVQSGLTLSGSQLKGRKGMPYDGGPGVFIPPRKREQDLLHCINRFDPPQGLPPSKSSQTVHLRSSRLPVAKASLAPKITALLAGHGISISRLVMPTRSNIDRLGALIQAAENLLETKRSIERLEQDIRVFRAQAGFGGDHVGGAADATGDSGAAQEKLLKNNSNTGVPGLVDSPIEVEVGGSGQTHPSMAEKRLVSGARKRSMSVSSNATSSTARGGNKRARRD